MKLLLSLAILFGSAAAQAKCICYLYTSYETICESNGNYCQDRPTATYIALAIIGSKEYRLAEYSSRESCLKFIAQAPECK